MFLAAYHDALIASKKLKKLAEEVQLEISAEGLAKLTEEKKLNEDYQVHGAKSQYFQDLIEKTEEDKINHYRNGVGVE
jgi:hypothetical protein